MATTKPTGANQTNNTAIAIGSVAKARDKNAIAIGCDANALDEKEREEFSRLKVIKKRHG